MLRVANCMTFKRQSCKRRKKTYSFKIDPCSTQSLIFKIRLVPWMRCSSGVIWLASLAVGKSTRQINDWMNKRKRKSCIKLTSSLTGKYGNKIQAWAIRFVRHWLTQLPPGDAIVLRCESALPQKQFEVWKKWFQRHEDIRWRINDEFKSFYIYRSSNLE